MTDATRAASRAVADEKLNQLGLGKEDEKKRSQVGERERTRPHETFGSDDVPYFLRREQEAKRGYPSYQSHQSHQKQRSSTTPDAAPTRKHAGERTAPHAPHSYIKGEEKFKVTDTLSLPQAAMFSEAAAKFITNRVHEAMADALQKYGLIWTSPVALQMKDHIRDSLERCTYRKEEGDDATYLAVRVGGNEIDG